MTISRGMIMASVGAMALLLMPAPIVAQDSGDVETARRVDRLERELRAVQRRVFPGAESGLFQPEAQPPGTTPAPVTTGGPLVDLTARVDALETQMARLTGQVEQQGFQIREMQSAIAALRSTAAPAAAPSGDGGSSAPTALAPAPTATASPAPRPTPAPTASPTPRPAATSTGTTPASAAARRARVEAIEVPASGNAAEDDYLYGYRLWEARLYPEAQAQLQRVLERHPNHRRASYAGNLLGRAYLDNGQAALAVGAFHDNYRNRARGERAPDSVYYMGMALIRLNRRTDACRTFDEFDRVYGATAREELKTQVQAGRATAGCS